MNRVVVIVVSVWLLLCSAQPQPEATWFNDVEKAEGVVYGLHDNAGATMDGLRIRRSYANSDYKYFGVYHTLVGSEFQVRLAKSSDLLRWTFVRTLLPNADMPYVYQMGSDDKSWIFLAHEQWMNPNSESPSRLGFKMYYTEADFFAGKYASSYLAPMMDGLDLMGTPNIYSAVMQNHNGYWVISGIIGFHYHKDDVDKVSQASLVNFCDPVGSPTWNIIGNSSYEDSIARLGVSGNIGDRDFTGDAGIYISLQEGNLGPNTPVNWANWRVFMYLWSNYDKSISYPTGSGTWYPLKPVTKGGSYAFGNPALVVLPHPSKPSVRVIAVTYFLFSQGAAPGEAGSLLFYHSL